MNPGKIITAAVFNITLTNRNDGRGHHWGRTHRTRLSLPMILAQHRQAKPFDRPVHVVITRVLGKGQRLFDADSLGRGNAKELIDALVELNWFKDDKPKHIVNCDFRQDDTDRANGPYVRIEVYEVTKH